MIKVILYIIIVIEEKDKFIVMETLTGHRFCVVNPQRDDFSDSDQVNEWDELPNQTQNLEIVQNAQGHHN